MVEDGSGIIDAEGRRGPSFLVVQMCFASASIKSGDGADSKTIWFPRSPPCWFIKNNNWVV